ncbi:hypothetical protein CA262_16995 [Sphingobium sp. GW456-12-10-14-TSB1]|uniref:Uncharacterized protein n=1 Tax=Sphingobium xenophagum TaxID=121428 RepID=A0A249MT13_SPHXE|nr:hypothetical protein CJD35_07340 [Sphingobium xenophagum]OUC56360.1 hypothetical protein CA262_16995 [Sphingobium sp. GW456-12-10-14-TSB1]
MKPLLLPVGRAGSSGLASHITLLRREGRARNFAKFAHIAHGKLTQSRSSAGAGKGVGWTM